MDVSEQQLEDLVRQHVDKIEDGLRYVGHQRITDSGRLDVLFVDSGQSLVLAELKVVEDDAMLFQAIDYYDYVSSNLEAFARLYNTFSIDPTQPARLFLVAPSFSQSLINRCKWIDIPISLFSYQCIRLDSSAEVIPVFSEQTIPSPPEVLETYSIDDRLAYITDSQARATARDLLDEIVAWDTNKILVEPIKFAISLKVSGRLFAYLSPRRKHFVIETYNQEGRWTGYSVQSSDDLDIAKELMRHNFSRFLK
ncbi:MAG TPA: hypothetical protein VF528_21035 [Pyrinomonadaceae bacterium]|jgi:hypothetical protein